jgi:hypothetical protein
VAFVALAHGYAAADRFAFLLKSLEAVVVGGLMAIAGGLFVAITAGLFDALGVQLPEWVARLFIAGGTGLVVVLAVALVYDPRARPADQSFDEGVSRLVALLLRLLLPLAIVVLVVYLGFIPFNFREPFENREVLIAFNAMLFAVVALLVGATPISGAELPAGTQRWLRRGVIALAVLALAVGVYALAAIIYRTATDRLTPNRFAFIGWNVINIGVLAALLAGQWRVRAGNRASIPERTNAAPFSTGGPALPLPGWIAALQGVFAGAMVPYLVWTVAVILVTPWIFHGAPPGYADLPESVRRIVYEQPDPILLKCPLSPHVYLFKDGHKLWIKDIPTFESEGFRWDDVELVPCSDLWKVPDGNPIPAGAGSPPLP